MSIFKAFLFGFILNLTIFGMGYGLICAADVELILGTSSGFNVVRGTTVAGGTSTIYVGSATVSINSNTQGAMLYIAGSSSANTDASLHVVNTSGTSTLYVRNDGNVGVGTTTPGTALYVIGTITATNGFVGSLSGGTNVNTTNINATTITTGSLTAGSATVTTLTTTGSATVTGTLTAASNNFVVGSTGSMTASSITVSTGTLTVANGAFKVDETGSMTAARVTASSMTVTTGTLTAANGAFKVDENGSMTATTITSTGSVTASTMSIAGTATIATTSGANVGIGTTSPGYKLEVNGSMRISSGSGGGLVFADGSTLSTFPSGTSSQWTTSGSNIYNNNLGNVGIGTTTPQTALVVIGTITATAGYIGDGSGLTGVSASSADANSVNSSSIQDSSITGDDLSSTLSMTSKTLNIGSLTVSSGNFRVDSAGSMTATTITSTGSATVSGTLTAANSTFRADTNFTYVTTRLGIGTTTPGSSYLMQVTSDGDTGVVIGSSGSMTAKTLAVTGTATVTGTLTASNALRVDTNTLVVDAQTTGFGIGTTTPATTLHVIGTVTASQGVIFGDATYQTTANYRNRVVLSSDVINDSSVAAADTLVNITGLSFGVNSGTTYRFYALIMYTSVFT